MCLGTKTLIFSLTTGLTDTSNHMKFGNRLVGMRLGGNEISSL
jgi:ligand-binding sensor protein